MPCSYAGLNLGADGSVGLHVVFPFWKDAARRLRDGGVLAFPTETFYGLGCCADQAVAVARVYQAKRRPVHMPLPLLAGSLDLLRPYVTLEQAPEALLTAFWPGPLTVVLTASSRLL